MSTTGPTVPARLRMISFTVTAATATSISFSTEKFDAFDTSEPVLNPRPYRRARMYPESMPVLQAARAPCTRECRPSSRRPHGQGQARR